MKQEEKNRLMRAKIIDAALHEFGEKSYAEASINTICEQDGISKGNVYHYFTDKDTLYLACAQSCFDAILRHLRESLPPAGQGVDRDLSAYFKLRQRFFEDNPCYRGFFYQISSTPPFHLKEAVQEIRTPFDQFNIAAFTDVLKQAELRPGVTLSEVTEIHMALQNALLNSEQMRKVTADGVAAREALSLHWMDILLHGVINNH